MGYKTKVDWCDSTWSPVTGCLHGCEYCYARGIANRFSAADKDLTFIGNVKFTSPSELEQCAEYRGHKEPYPFGFAPTLHRYRLDIPQKWSEQRNIFVCSMGELFGAWVPDEWIEEVFKACEKAPQHRYLFLTKNPARYIALAEAGKLPERDNMWYGSSAPTPETKFFFAGFVNTFVSVEPIHAPFTGLVEDGIPSADWIIVGAETGNRKDKVIPKKEWITELADYAESNKVPVFMKESLRELMGEDFRQEFPWEV